MSATSEGGSSEDGDLLVVNAGQLLTLAGPPGPRSGRAMGDLGVLRSGAVLVKGGRIAAVGPQDEVVSEAGDAGVLDARGRVVMPGFVDAHTHAAFVGSRAGELTDKLAGKSYAQIAAGGGGIQRTVRATRTATEEELREQTAARLQRMVRWGTTTVEVKSGYALDREGELRMLRVLGALAEDLPVDVVPTFLGAHATPPEWEGDPDGYVGEIVDNILPAVASQGIARFCDAFVEEGFFTASQGRRILLEGRRHGLVPKVHADELTRGGGAELAAEVEAASADHLLHASPAGLRALAEGGVVGVLLPGTSFATLDLPYADARGTVDAGVPVALGTDLSPNAWIESMPFIVSLACYRLRMQPEEALTAATLNAAWAVGAAQDVGSLEVGKKGDLLLLGLTDPGELPTRIASNPVETVVKEGRIVASRP